MFFNEHLGKDSLTDAGGTSTVKLIHFVFLQGPRLAAVYSLSWTNN